MTFKQQIEEYLKDIPSKWKDSLVQLLCEINSSQNTVSCEDVKNCETLTSLSEFSVNETQISIQYTGEDGVTVTRSVDISSVLNNIFENLDPECLADITTWQNLSFEEKLQLIVDSHCHCCDEGLSLRVFITEFDETAPYNGFIALYIDTEFIIGSSVTFDFGDSISDIIDDLNNNYNGLATFSEVPGGIQTTMLTDNYEGITLRYFQQFT